MRFTLSPDFELLNGDERIPTHYSCAFIIWPDGRRELRPICHVQGAQQVSAELAEVDCLECLRVVGERMKSE